MESEKIGRERGRRNRGRERERGERDGKSGYRECGEREKVGMVCGVRKRVCDLRVCCERVWQKG